MPETFARRDEPTCFQIADRPTERLSGTPLIVGDEVRVVSRDLDNGSITTMTTLPAGWRVRLEPGEGLLEAFVVDGRLAVDGRPHPSATYVRFPSVPVELATAEPTRLLVFWNPTHPGMPAERAVTRWAWDSPWEQVVFDDFPVGLLTMRLREDDRSGGTAGPDDGWVRLTLSGPGFMNNFHERHPGCFEENIFLSGDFHMPNRGTLTPGDVLSNPPDFWHGPMGTKGGALFIVHCDRSMGVELRDAPAEYVQSLRTHVETTAWA